MKYLKILSIAIISLALFSCTNTEDGWISLYDGESLEGWTASENADSWKIDQGVIVTGGERSHLFYTGDVMDHQFKNFEFSVDVKTTPYSNSGVYIHTVFQEEGWPAQGYECQVLNSSGEGDYVERKMSGSIYAVRNNWKSVQADNEWYTYRIKVVGKTVQTYINDMLVVEYTEPEVLWRPEGWEGRKLNPTGGTFAFQCHDPKSVVAYKNIKVKPLADDLPTPGTPPADLAFEEQIVRLSTANFPLIDFHTHLKGGITREEALAHARSYGFTYGIAVNCGLKMGFESDEELEAYLNAFEPTPMAWHAMQAEGREWLELFSKENRERFDYVFTDAMTWTNKNGVRQRLWIPEETEVGDPQDFMDQLVDNIVKVVTEPIDIHVNPTYLPAEIADQYDTLWTDERIDRVVKALAENGVALEINNRFRIPSAKVIKKAKEAGVKFTFGTNNGGADDLGRMDYGIEMISVCGLTPQDMWFPVS
jgi:3-keto-disaccharide hydrolase